MKKITILLLAMLLVFSLVACGNSESNNEGVETEAQLSLCKALHIDLMQGYLLSVPMSADQIEIQLNAAFHRVLA